MCIRDTTYPTRLCDIVKFERDNTDVSINLFGYEENEIYLLRITPSSGRQHHVNLFNSRLASNLPEVLDS